MSGSDDYIFPPDKAQKIYVDIFEKLQINDTLKAMHVEPNNRH